MAQGLSTHGWAEFATLTPPAEPVVIGMVRSLSISWGGAEKRNKEEEEEASGLYHLLTYIDATE